MVTSQGIKKFFRETTNGYYLAPDQDGKAVVREIFVQPRFTGDFRSVIGWDLQIKTDHGTLGIALDNSHLEKLASIFAPTRKDDHVE